MTRSNSSVGPVMSSPVSVQQGPHHRCSRGRCGARSFRPPLAGTTGSNGCRCVPRSTAGADARVRADLGCRFGRTSTSRAPGLRTGAVPPADGCAHCRVEQRGRGDMGLGARTCRRAPRGAGPPPAGRRTAAHAAIRCGGQRQDRHVRVPDVGHDRRAEARRPTPVMRPPPVRPTARRSGAPASTATAAADAANASRGDDQHRDYPATRSGQRRAAKPRTDPGSRARCQWRPRATSSVRRAAEDRPARTRRLGRQTFVVEHRSPPPVPHDGRRARRQHGTAGRRSRGPCHARRVIARSRIGSSEGARSTHAGSHAQCVATVLDPRMEPVSDLRGGSSPTKSSGIVARYNPYAAASAQVGRPTTAAAVSSSGRYRHRTVAHGMPGTWATCSSGGRRRSGERLSWPGGLGSPSASSMSGSTGSPTRSPPRASDPATAWPLRSATATSTSRRCSPRSSCGPCRST